MPDETRDSRPASGEGVADSAVDALAAVDASLADARHAGRPVLYALREDATRLSREEVEAWMTGAEAEGLTRFRYAMRPRDDGSVLVEVGADAPDGSPAAP